MDRAQLEAASMEDLQREVIRYHLPFSPDRAALIESILTHLERHGPNDPSKRAQEGAGSSGELSAVDQLRQSMEQMSENLRLQQQNFMTLILERLQQTERVVQAVGAASGGQSGPQVVQGESSAGSSAETPRREAVERQDRLQKGHAVQCLATQIPEFSGGSEEKVEVWIRRVDHVARVHGATDGITLLAATSQFKKGVKKWYDTLEGEPLETWQALKQEMAAMYESNEFAYTELQKVQSKMWRHGKETFQEYAIAKIAIMNRLELSVKEKIHLLISGITLSSMKSAALTLADLSMSQFLKKMRCVAEGSSETEKKMTVPASAQTNKEKLCRNCGKKGHAHQECRAEPSCFYCKETGHRQFDCPVLKKKTGVQPTQPKQRMLTAAAVDEESEDEVMVAAVSHTSSSQLDLDEPCVTVTSVCKENCKLSALIDTGSPVSIIKFQIYKEFLLPLKVELLPPRKRLRSITNGRITVLGNVNTEITMEPFGDKRFTVEFYIVDDSACCQSMLLGRDFVAKEELLLKFSMRNSDANGSAEQINISAELAKIEPEVTTETIESIISEANTDFGDKAQRELVNTIKVETEIVESVDDGYTVRVPIEDESVYAYAPRRFAFAERIEMREIIDDLLRRGIIQPSRSPYCARVIPSRKKNNKRRLGIDLRPLNSRISIPREVMLQLKRYHFELHYWKCQLLQRQIEFIGYIISEEGITLSARHNEAICRFKCPGNVLELQRFLGLAGYYRKSIKNSSINARPLLDLLRKHAEYNVDERCVAPFESLKHELEQFTRSWASVDDDIESDRKKVSDAARQASEKIKKYNKICRDERLRRPTEYRRSEHVLICGTRMKPGTSRKIKCKYKGPYLVAKDLGNNRYGVRDIPGFNHLPQPRDTSLSSDCINPGVKLSPPMDE